MIARKPLRKFSFSRRFIKGCSIYDWLLGLILFDLCARGLKGEQHFRVSTFDILSRDPYNFLKRQKAG